MAAGISIRGHSNDLSPAGEMDNDGEAAVRGRGGRVGRLAQLAERLVYTEKAGGSNPSSPTTGNRLQPPLIFQPRTPITAWAPPVGVPGQEGQEAP